MPLLAAVLLCLSITACAAASLVVGVSSLRLPVSAVPGGALAAAAAAWPRSLLSVDVDVVPQRASAGSGAEAATDARLSAALHALYGAEVRLFAATLRAVGDGGGGAAPRAAACAALAALLPWLPLRGCGNGSGAAFDLDLMQAAALAPAVVRRDGSLGDAGAPAGSLAASPVAALDAAAEDAADAPPKLRSAWQWGGGRLAAWRCLRRNN